MNTLSPGGPLRRLVKRLAARLPENMYANLRALTAAWDIRTGRWSEPELDLIPFALWPGETAIDVGAHFGLWSHHLSRRVGPAGQVFAFEPVPSTFAVLEATLRLLRARRVRAFEIAVGAAANIVELRVPQQTCGVPAAGQTCLRQRDDARPGRERHARHPESTVIQVVQAALDGVYVSDRPVSFLKLDVEGGELFALRGATALIERDHPTIVCEINPWFLEGLGLTVADLVGFFTTLGYGCYWYDDATRSLWSQWPEVEDNYVFIHPSRDRRFLDVFADEALRRAIR